MPTNANGMIDLDQTNVITQMGIKTPTDDLGGECGPLKTKPHVCSDSICTAGS